MTGLVVLDKPAGMTSFAAAAAVGRALGEQRVGHGGTLDPMATGVLPVCLGEATKLAAFLLGGDKEYEAELAFGVATDTLDADGAVVARGETAQLSEQAIRCALGAFVGTITQRPPMYSAVRIGGQRLHELARAGVQVERAPRTVVVDAIDLLEFGAGPRARLRIACGKGTYIRVLAADLAEALGSCGHLAALRRTRSGPFSIGQAIALDAVTKAAVLPMQAALPSWPRFELGSDLERRIRAGQRIPAREIGLPASAVPGVRLETPAGNLVALAEVRADGVVHVLRGFNYGLTPGGGVGHVSPETKGISKEEEEQFQ
jgi:tRNA pseudouridine55 synthase